MSNKSVLVVNNKTFLDYDKKNPLTGDKMYKRLSGINILMKK